MTVTLEHDLDAGALAAARAIRHAVFTVEQGIPATTEAAGDDGAEHVLARVDGRPAATGRLVATSAREGVLARIAVLPAHRGAGLGRQVVAALETLARARGLRAVSLQPHAHLERFYAAMGYQTFGDREIVAGHPLIWMRKTL